MTPRAVQEIHTAFKDFRSEVVLLFRDIRATDLRSASLEDVQDLQRQIRAIQLYARACDEHITAKLKEWGEGQ